MRHRPRAGALSIAAAAALLVVGGTVVAPVTAGAAPGPTMITLDGKPVVVHITATGQPVQLGFAGTSGQRVSVVITHSTVGPDCPALVVALQRTDGSQRGASSDVCGATGFLDAHTLDRAGNWSVVLTPHAGDQGHLTVQAYAVTDHVGTIVRNGVPVAVSITTPGQNARFSFSSVSGQQVSAVLSNATFGATCGTARVSLVRPNGTAFGTVASSCNTQAFLDGQTLDADGTWSLLVDPLGAHIGTAKLAAYNTDDKTGLTRLDGDMFAVPQLNPGQNATIHFAGDRGEKVSALVTHAAYGGCPGVRLALLRPDGSAFGTHVDTCKQSGFLDAQTLDQAGQWSILVDPQGAAVGTAQLQAWDATDATKAIQLNGAPITATLDPGQNGVYTFHGDAGQQVSLTATDAHIPGCPGYRLELLRPDGSVLGAPATGCGASGFLDSRTLDGTGTWTFEIDPVASARGTATLKGFTFADDDGAADLSGKPAHLRLPRPGQNAHRTFTGHTGDGISAYVTDASLTGCKYSLSLVRPDGTRLGRRIDSCGATAYLDTRTLDQNGTWTVVVDPVGTDIGDATLQVFAVVDEVQTIKPGRDITTFTSETPGTNASFRIAGRAGDTRTVTISASTYERHPCPALVVDLRQPDGTVAASAKTCGGGLTIANVKLDSTGTWTLVIDPQGPATGTLIIRLT